MSGSLWTGFTSGLTAALRGVSATGLPGRAKRPMKSRFEDKYTPEPNTGCWLWDAATARGGYGAFKVDGRLCGAHRVAWEIYVGPINCGLSVLHRCDQPLCVNPSHLFLGTSADNVADRESKGRTSRGARHRERVAWGENNGQAKLSAADVAAIRSSHELTQASLAREYGVSQQQVSRILNGKKWANEDNGAGQ